MRITIDPVLRRRLVWFAAIYVVSVLAFAAVSGFLELLVQRS
jgi:Protein of unknown function (DUF2474)